MEEQRIPATLDQWRDFTGWIRSDMDEEEELLAYALDLLSTDETNRIRTRIAASPALSHDFEQIKLRLKAQNTKDIRRQIEGMSASVPWSSVLPKHQINRVFVSLFSTAAEDFRALASALNQIQGVIATQVTLPASSPAGARGQKRGIASAIEVGLADESTIADMARILHASLRDGKLNCSIRGQSDEEAVVIAAGESEAAIVAKLRKAL